MKIKDAMSDYITSDLGHTYKLLTDMYPEWRPNTNIVCPYHEDNNASLSIDVTGKAYCFGCGFRSSNIIELFAHAYGLTYVAARKLMYHNMVNAIADTHVDAYVRTLHNSTKRLAWITDTRHVSMDVIHKYKLGYASWDGRYTIPIYDRFNTCVNIRRYSLDADHKMINQKGHGGFRIFPEQVLCMDSVHYVLIVEGEWDCLVGLSNGIPTVTGTGGAGLWEDQYNWMFQDKHVFVLYDNDKAGKSGASVCMNSIKSHALSVTQLPPLAKKGKDLSDWWNKIDELKTSITAAFANNTSRGSCCTSCGTLLPKYALRTVTPTNPVTELKVCKRCERALLSLGWSMKGVQE